ncbi:MAG: hypothetical protein H8K10_10630 [Nitrospira sp.]|nr:hypothetical protein [Nitrospira sp.]
MKSIARALWRAIDLLDVVLLAALSLITFGVYQLAGSGWACVTLGGLLLSLVMIGVPTGKPPAR